MPLEIIRNDITKVYADAIVNTANDQLMPGGGVCGAIFAAAGRADLETACKSIGGCEVGQAVITPGFHLPATYIIHTVGPVWQGGGYGEEKLLADCYRNSLMLAKEHHIDSIAFPLISSGIYGYPKDKALHVAISSIESFLLENEMLVYLVVYDRESFYLSEKLSKSITAYIDDHFVDAEIVCSENTENLRENNNQFRTIDFKVSAYVEKLEIQRSPRHLDNVFDQLDETFSQTVLRLIDEKGTTDVQTYKKANLDRKLFSKIRSDKHYKPSRQTAIALAIALELNLDETKDLIGKAGFALSHCSKFDLIIEYFIQHKIYKIFEINEALFYFDQPLLK